jgi:penicillin amidase
VLGEVPWLNGLFEINVPHGGEKDTVNAGGFTVTDELNPFRQIHGPGYRAIYDLAEPDRSVFIQSSGQSGNPFSPFYRSMAERWAKGDYIRIPTALADIERTAIGTWVLEGR